MVSTKKVPSNEKATRASDTQANIEKKAAKARATSIHQLVKIYNTRKTRARSMLQDKEITEDVIDDAESEEEGEEKLASVAEAATTQSLRKNLASRVNEDAMSDSDSEKDTAAQAMSRLSKSSSLSGTHVTDSDEESREDEGPAVPKPTKPKPKKLQRIDKALKARLADRSFFPAPGEISGHWILFFEDTDREFGVLSPWRKTYFYDEDGQLFSWLGQ
jgi:hypothetical protein